MVFVALLAAGVTACSATDTPAAGVAPAPSAGVDGPGAPSGPARPARASPTAPADPSTPVGPSAPAGPSAARPLAGKVVVIDPGHNGGNAAHPEIINRLVNVVTERKACDTTGTQTDAGYPEHAFTFSVATGLARLLRREGAKVILTRSNDHGVGPCITQRARIGNRAHADAAISVHADGGPPSGIGFQVLVPGLVPGYNNRIIRPSRRLGLGIRTAYHRITGEPYSTYAGQRGIEVRTDLGGLNLSTVPKVFIECGNMRNAADAARLTSPAFRQRIVKGLAAGLTAFLRAPG